MRIMLAAALATAAFSAPAAAVTTVYNSADLDCVPVGGGSACFADYPFFYPDFVPPGGRTRTTIRTRGVPLTVIAELAPVYRWRFDALDGSLMLGNTSYGEISYLASRTGQATGFLSNLVVTPFAISFIADVPPNTDRCATLFAAYGTTGYACSEVFLGVEPLLASLGFDNPPERIAVTTVRQSLAAGAVPEPASWLLLIAGFGLSGAKLRRRRRVAA